jgi:signal transduction histidine kinase
MNPWKAADEGVLRSALDPSDSAAPSSLIPLDVHDRGRAGSHALEPAPTARHVDGLVGLAMVLVDPDPAQCATRRGHLSSGGAARVITANDEFDVADAMRLMDPDVVIVSASDTISGGKLIRAVRAQFDVHHEPVPILAWPSRLSLQGTPADLLEAGADAIIGDDAPTEDVLATVRALRRVIASASRRSTQQLAGTASVLDALQLSVALIDRDGRVHDANTAMRLLWREMTGQRSSPEGSDLAHFVVPSDRPLLAEAIVSLFAAPAGAVTDLEGTMGGSPARGIPVHVRLVRLEDSAAGPLVVAQVTDLREKRRVEELAHASRWRALDRQQILDLSVRLRGLLSAVSQSVSSLGGARAGADLTLSSTHASMLRGTLAQSDQLLEGLQAIATEQEHSAALLDVCALVHTHLDLFQQMLPSHVVLTWDATPAGLLVRGSETQLQQVLTALVMNAWDAQRSGGAIHVNVRFTADVVVIGVEDQGPGVPEEKHDWIFLPMTSTRSAEGASGMGLVTARRVVEMHGGQLRLDRFRDVGARFEAILPRYQSRTPTVKPQIQAVPPRRVVAGL